MPVLAFLEGFDVDFGDAARLGMAECAADVWRAMANIGCRKDLLDVDIGSRISERIECRKASGARSMVTKVSFQSTMERNRINNNIMRS